MNINNIYEYRRLTTNPTYVTKCNGKRKLYEQLPGGCTLVLESRRGSKIDYLELIIPNGKSLLNFVRTQYDTVINNIKELILNDNQCKGIELYTLYEIDFTLLLIGCRFKVQVSIFNSSVPEFLEVFNSGIRPEGEYVVFSFKGSDFDGDIFYQDCLVEAVVRDKLPLQFQVLSQAIINVFNQVSEKIKDNHSYGRIEHPEKSYDKGRINHPVDVTLGGNTCPMPDDIQ